ncbi:MULTISPECIES: ABC transporter permease [Rhodococcus]|uniref:ABC transporter n=1 Tax=Rhodococcus opacus RKJ300 = JCM 13270 TaxID=1165867 RepID=I0WYP5_RHOOP|nr:MULTISPECIES: ABC transporter permease [Rhodococcus]EID81511.1 ABC transporter [Rhodococcus opacus RKJ300 = JCM 13270]QQZ17218.1 ABC transporter permease [Rhodococcus sp. 21391]
MTFARESFIVFRRQLRMNLRNPAWVIIGLLQPVMYLGGACAAASNAFALTTKSEDVMAPVISMVMMPVLLLSGILLPMTIGPAWLQTASDFMPIRHVVDAVRDSFFGDFANSAIVWGTAWAVVLFVVAVWWGTRTFRKENA